MPCTGFLRTDPAFVLRFLQAYKYDVEASFEVYVNYYRFMHTNRDFYVGFNINNPEVISSPPPASIATETIPL